MLFEKFGFKKKSGIYFMKVLAKYQYICPPAKDMSDHF